jgi:2-oxoglutarate dehydrogenase E1 component
MALDFERDYGVNAGYVQALFESWQADPASVDGSWRAIFERSAASEDAGQAAGHGAADHGKSIGIAARPAAAPAAAMAPSTRVSQDWDARAGGRSSLPTAGEARSVATQARRAEPAADEAELEPLVGVAGRIATNMSASLEIPTATSVRTIPAKVLLENRTVLNEHMQLRALGKASFTHLVAFALAKVLAEQPRMLASFVPADAAGEAHAAGAGASEKAGVRAYRKLPRQVNLGLAIDVTGPKGRSLVVPCIHDAAALDFRAFHAAYEDLVERARGGKLGPADYAGTNVTLTNPGGFGTEMSVPRLMVGQGLIVATGAIGVPAQIAGASAEALAAIAVGPVMTVTSTYDHRVIQGAESGLFLKRLEELLAGEPSAAGGPGFYDEVFRALRVPWKPWSVARDVSARASEAEKQSRVGDLIAAYRIRGARIADLDPLEYRPDPHESLDPTSYGFTIWDLDRTFLCGGMNGQPALTLREILAVLRRAYCRRWSVEYMHITDRARKQWVRERVENPAREVRFTRERILEILRRLHRAENLERFLHARYVGNKRFSLEGADTLIPALSEAIERAAESGVEKVVIGMAHRGRLNVLANILGKRYEEVFREFEGVLLPYKAEGSGDVKYHLGQRGVYKTRAGREVEVLLSPNPSHLEAVDPVVCGMARAWQDALGDGERRRVLAILVHGDAAFSGQGVVAETLNMSRLRAYSNGGTLHLVVNNQIGFTAGPRDLRSTYYCTDVAKSIEAPILHANGDYPESVLRAVALAVDYQREFGEDAVVDMVCYRRWGHNEGDEPAYTQPLLYARIRKHPTVVETYAELLKRRGDLTEDELGEIDARFAQELEEAKRRVALEPLRELPVEEVIDLTDDDPADYVARPSSETALSPAKLVELVDRLNKMPEGHVVHPNLLRQLRRREHMVRGEQGVDWGCAEALAFASLLEEGVPIRLAGQDSGRGTFSHRHAVIRDQATEKDHVPLRTIRPDVSFEAWDSLLSEEAALAFEYGYSIRRREALVLWEAQFGDFANGAQIPIDQFVAAGQTKWKETSGVTLLLPHGFDGQGPEHSSGRIERFLTLCASGNMTVANCTTSAQYFHLLRRQGRARERRPLVVFTPKSLLREPRAASPVEAFASGGFHELLRDPLFAPQAGAGARRADRVLFCSGKVFYDLEAQRAAQKIDDVMIVRLEQLYPIASDAIQALLAEHPGAEVVWVQEEPRNMGPWPFMLQRFTDLAIAATYCGRPESPSPATGSYRRHSAEQEHLVKRAFG